MLAGFYKERDNKWLGILLERYTMLLYGVSMKYLRNEEEAKDAVQQVFLKALSELQKYKVEYFKSWLYMIARNHCLMKIREKAGRIPAELNEETMADDTEPGAIQSHIEKDRTLELMSRTLEELNVEQKQCVTLFYLEKRSYQEITEITGYTMMQVKSYIQNGKRNLKTMLDRKISDGNAGDSDLNL